MVPLICLIFVLISTLTTTEGSKKCGFSKLPRPANADLSDFSVKHRTSEFECQHGYVLASTRKKTQTISCGASGWQKSEPCVKQKSRQCKTPLQWRRNLPHLHLNGDYQIGEAINITCPKRLRLKGRVSRKCGTTGWNDGGDVNCVRNTCKVPKEWKQTVEEILNDEIWVGRKMLVTCPMTKQTIPSLKAKGGIITCLANGKFDIEDGPICKSKGRNCAVPSSWMKAFYSMSLRPLYLPGATIIFSRWPKDVVRSSSLDATNDVVTCREEGKWSPAKPFLLKTDQRTERHEKPVEKIATTHTDLNKRRKHCRTPEAWREMFRTFPRKMKANSKVVLNTKTCPGGKRDAEVERVGGTIFCTRDGHWSVKPDYLCPVCVFPMEWVTYTKGVQLRRKYMFPGQHRKISGCKRKDLKLHPSIVKAGGKLTCTKEGRFNVNPRYLCTNAQKEAFTKFCPLPKKWSLRMGFRQKDVAPYISIQLMCRQGKVSRRCLPGGRWAGNPDITKDICTKQDDK
ncbi:uncharacterized protein LOC135500476 [Lineus longissimus]|uniref:uncharacterized protein LOC135500476 n=1 Tax=Lineus longissimus TaxID=88925 RepID=UPI002B4EDA97